MNPIQIREILSSDLESIQETLSNLTMLIGRMNPDQWDEYLHYLSINPLHKVFVAVMNETVVGTVTCFITLRIIHNGGFVAHIEDVATDKNYEGYGIASKLIEYSIGYAKSKNAYKIILDCNESLVPFYEKFDFTKAGHCLRKEL